MKAAWEAEENGEKKTWVSGRGGQSVAGARREGSKEREWADVAAKGGRESRREMPEQHR